VLENRETGVGALRLVWHQNGIWSRCEAVKRWSEWNVWRATGSGVQRRDSGAWNKRARAATNFWSDLGRYPVKNTDEETTGANNGNQTLK